MTPLAPCHRPLRLPLLTAWMALVSSVTLTTAVHAGGAWVPARGQGDAQLGFSRKTADTSWDAFGDSFNNSGRFENHDFRYTYAAGEVGVAQRLSFTYLVTWLDGFEGPDGDLHRNTGFSDAWLGLKWALRSGSSPMALRLVVRTPILYDIDGPYSLELYDDDGELIGLSPEWRGVLKHDATLSWLWSRSILDYRGWISLDSGYTWRQGAPADQWPLHVDVGVPVSRSEVGFWSHARLKVSLDGVLSLGNDSQRQPDDRFGSRSSFNFNDASMARLGASLLVPFGSGGRWTLEAGYAQWLWGESARQYREPFVSVSRSF